MGLGMHCSNSELSVAVNSYQFIVNYEFIANATYNKTINVTY